MDTSDLHIAGIIAAIVVAIGFLIERTISIAISHFGKRENLLPSHLHLMRLILRWVIVVTVILVVLSVFGIAIANLWITMSAIIFAALVAFFAGWSLLANVLATLLILIWRPFLVGDRISLLPEDISGEVRDTNLFYTRLKTETGEMIQVPNVFFFQKFIKVTRQKENQ